MSSRDDADLVTSEDSVVTSCDGKCNSGGVFKGGDGKWCLCTYACSALGLCCGGTANYADKCMKLESPDKAQDLKFEEVGSCKTRCHSGVFRKTGKTGTTELCLCANECVDLNNCCDDKYIENCVTGEGGEAGTGSQEPRLPETKTCEDRCHKGLQVFQNGFCYCDSQCLTSDDCCEGQEAYKFHCPQDEKILFGDQTQAPKFWGAAIFIILLSLFMAFGVWSWVVSRMQADLMNDLDHRGLHLQWEEEDFGHKLVLNWLVIRFFDRRIEEEYQAWSVSAKVKNSAWILTVGVCVMSFGVMMRIFNMYTAVHDPNEASVRAGLWFAVQTVNYDVLGKTPFVVASITVFCQFALCLYCACKPTELVFWLTLLVAFWYVPFTLMPPMAYTCEQLGSLEQGKGFFTSIDYMTGQAVRQADCTLAGQTAMQAFLAWLFLCPWLIPRQEVIHVVWVWIIGIFFGWTFAYEYFVGVKVYTHMDIYWRVMLLSISLLIATNKKYHLEKSFRLKFAQERTTRLESKKMFGTLEVMVPSHVVMPMMLAPGETITENIPCVSILFVLINEFDRFTREKTPRALLKFLNQQFTQYDNICETYQITKIETVGEEYVAAVGVLPEEVEEGKMCGHTNMVERLMTAGGEMLGTQTDKVKLKMGVHSGPIVAGVIGNKLPRYRLFGDVINSAARMMQKGIPGQLQFGQETHDMLSPEFEQKVKYRGEVEMKGKGLLKAWTYVPVMSEPEPLVAPAISVTSAGVDSATEPVASSATMATSRFVAMFNMMPMLRTTNASDGSPFDDEKEKAFNNTLEHLQRSWDEGSSTFSASMEEEWVMTNHLENFSKKIRRRFVTSAFWILMFTGVEYIMMHSLTTPIWQYDHVIFRMGNRLPAFIISRGVCVAINLVWWYIAETTKWIYERPNAAQNLVCFTELLILLLFWISYDAVGFADSKLYEAQNKSFNVPDDQSVVLDFIIFFNVSLNVHKFTFRRALLLLPTLLLAINWFRVWRLIRTQWGIKAEPAWEWEDNFSLCGDFLLVFMVLMHLRVVYEDERSSRSLFKASKALKATTERTQRILTTLMPEAVVQEIRESTTRELPCHAYRHLVIAQSDLCGFTQLSASRSATEVVEMMGELFGLFDNLTDKYGVYKVETVGDAYIAGMADPPLTKTYSPVSVVVFGLDMVRATDTWATRLNVKVTCRVGIHYGECIGGIVGNKMQRYHLFGDTMTVMEVLESTSEEGRVQISTACKNEVLRQLADEPQSAEEVLGFELRTCDKLRTSKGEEHEYSEVGGKTFLVSSDRSLRHSV